MWPSSSKTSPVVYQTDIGRLRDIRLSDGSKIILGGLTKISVEFSATQRSVSLVNGQAWFKVAHDQRRSFIVSAGDGTIADVGTAFLVTRDSDRVVVSVTEGTVEVSTRLSVSSRLQMRQTAPIRVRQGEQLVFGDNGALSGAKRTDTHAAMAWTNEQLMFEDQPLRYVIETVNRYSARRILVSPAAGQLRLSGIVFENDIQEWLQTLQAILPVTVQEQGSSLRIQTRDPTTISQPK
jgi:transmembrane sensor